MSHSRSAPPEYDAAVGAGLSVRAGLAEALVALVEGAAAVARGASTGSARTGEELSSVRITDPSLTLSPNATFSSLTTPAADDGISIDALSLSTVIRLCSAF